MKRSLKKIPGFWRGYRTISQYVAGSASYMPVSQRHLQRAMLRESASLMWTFDIAMAQGRSRE